MELLQDKVKPMYLQERVVDADKQSVDSDCRTSLTGYTGMQIHTEEEETCSVSYTEYVNKPLSEKRIKQKPVEKIRVLKDMTRTFLPEDFRNLCIFKEENNCSHRLINTEYTFNSITGTQNSTTETTKSMKTEVIKNNQIKFAECMETSTNVDMPLVDMDSATPASAHTLWNESLHEDCNTCDSDNGNGNDDLQKQIDQMNETINDLVERLMGVENNMETVNDILEDFTEDNKELRERLRVLYDMYTNTFTMLPSSAMNTGTPMLLYSRDTLESFDIYQVLEEPFLQQLISIGAYPNTRSTTTALFAVAFQEDDIDPNQNYVIRVGAFQDSKILDLECLGFGLSTVDGKHIGKGGIWTGNYENQEYEYYQRTDLTKALGFYIKRDKRTVEGKTNNYWILQDKSGDPDSIEYLLPTLMEDDEKPMYHYFQIANEPKFEGTDIIDQCVWTYISYTEDFIERKVSIKLDNFATMSYDVKTVTLPGVRKCVRIVKELPMPTYNIKDNDVGQTAPIAHNEHKACMRLLIEDSMEQVMIDLKENYQQMQEDLGNVPGVAADITSRYIDNLGVLWSMAAKSSSILDYTTDDLPSANGNDGKFEVRTNDGIAAITGMTLPDITTGYSVETHVEMDFIPDAGAPETVIVEETATKNLRLVESNTKQEFNGWEVVSRIENGDSIKNSGFAKASMNYTTINYPAAIMHCQYPSYWSPMNYGRPGERRTYFHRTFQTLATSGFNVVLPHIHKLNKKGGVVVSEELMTGVDVSSVDENGVLHILFYVQEMIPIVPTVTSFTYDEEQNVQPDNPHGWYEFNTRKGLRFATKRMSTTEFHLATGFYDTDLYDTKCHWEFPEGDLTEYKMSGGTVSYVGIGSNVPPTVPINDTELQSQIAEVDTRVSQIESEWAEAQNRINDFREASKRTPVYSLLSIGMSVASNLGVTHKLKAFTGVYAAASLVAGVRQENVYMILEGACTFAAMSNLLGKSRNVKTGTYTEPRDDEIEDDPDYLPKIHLRRRDKGEAGVDPNNYISEAKDDPSWNIEALRKEHVTEVGFSDNRIKNIPYADRSKRENDAGRTYESQKGGNSITLESTPLESLGPAGPYLRQINDKMISAGIRKGYKKSIVKSANKNSTNIEHTRLVVNSTTLLDAPIKIPQTDGSELKRDRFTHVAYIGVTEGVTSPMVATYGNLAGKKSQLLGGNGAQKGKPGITSLIHTTTEDGTNRYVTTGDLGLSTDVQRKEAAVVQTLITGKYHSVDDVEFGDGLSQRTSKGYEVLHNQSRNTKGLSKISSSKVPTIKGLSDYFSDIRSHQENFGEYNLLRNNCQNFAMDHYQALTQAVPRGSVPSTLTDMIATKGWSSDPTTQNDLANMRISWVNSSYDLMENGMGTSLLDPNSLITEIVLGESEVYVIKYKLSERGMVM